MYRIFNYIYSINYLGRQLLREVLNYSDEYLFEELTPRTLKKMHNFLVEHKCAETFKEIKSKNQINIKGCAPNGLERLIGKEIREQYGLDILEASEKFTTFYPIFSEGVIKYESVNGLHYTHFKVSGQTEKTFGMEIKEYKLYHNVFYLTYSIRIKEMSKHIPFYLSETVGEDIRHLLFSGPLSEEVDKEFSKLEKLMIRHTINNEQNYEEEMTIILYNTIANFRAVNFLWEKYNHDLLLHSISSDWFYDNDFFKINNWRYEIQGINDLDELYQKRLEDYCDYILNSKDAMMVLRKNTIDSVINGIVRKANITKLYAANTKLMPSALELILAGKIDQKEQNTEGHSIKRRNQKQEFVNCVTLHFLQKEHHILSGDGKNHVKGNNRNHQGAEKQTVFLSAAAAVPKNEIREHLRCPLPVAPSPSGCARRTPAGFRLHAEAHERSRHPG